MKFQDGWKYWTFDLTSKKSKMYSQILSKMTKSSLKRHDMAFSYEKYVAATTCLCHEEKIYKKFHCSILWTTKYQSNSNWLLWALFPLDKWVWFLKSTKTKESLYLYVSPFMSEVNKLQNAYCEASIFCSKKYLNQSELVIQNQIKNTKKHLVQNHSQK